jgi:hypothetical protein
MDNNFDYGDESSRQRFQTINPYEQANKSPYQIFQKNIELNKSQSLQEQAVFSSNFNKDYVLKTDQLKALKGHSNRSLT